MLILLEIFEFGDFSRLQQLFNLHVWFKAGSKKQLRHLVGNLVPFTLVRHAHSFDSILAGLDRLGITGDLADSLWEKP